jgi:hypothetical protein
VAASGEPGDPEESREAGAGADLLPRGLVVYDLAGGMCVRALQLAEPAGTILTIGADHALSLYRHPKLIELAAGRVLHV